MCYFVFKIEKGITNDSAFFLIQFNSFFEIVKKMKRKKHVNSLSEMNLAFGFG